MTAGPERGTRRGQGARAQAGTGSLEALLAAVTERAIEKLKEMIGSGQLRPGQRLPREPDLAASLGLSRSSLREAVRALASVRILDVRQGDGTYVSGLSAESLVEALAFLVEFQQGSSALELLEVRRALEPAAVARAAVRMSEEALEELERALERASLESPLAELVEADMQFHRLITSGCGNSVLASFVESLSGPTQRARIWRGMTQAGALSRALAEHWEILRALRARDPELAQMRAAVHIAGVEEWLRGALSLDRPCPARVDMPSRNADMAPTQAVTRS